MLVMYNVHFSQKSHVYEIALRHELKLKLSLIHQYSYTHVKCVYIVYAILHMVKQKIHNSLQSVVMMMLHTFCYPQ